MTFLNVGDHGWMIEGENEISEQQEKVDKVFFITERVLETLKEVVTIYSKFGDAEAFSTFESRVCEVMKKASFESFFNDDNYKNTDQS